MHRDEKVRHLVLELVPMLAAFHVHWFVNGRFDRAAPALQDSSSDPGVVAVLASLQGGFSDRPPAYRALGALAVATGSRILNNAAILNETLGAIQHGFRRRPFCAEAVACLQMVVAATVKSTQPPPKQVEQAFTKPGHMVRDMFRGGVTQDLVREVLV
jgi:hypothetical protein